MPIKLKFVNIPAPLFQLDIPDKAKMILAMALGFGEKGLYASNSELAGFFGCSIRTIINNINCLRDHGLVIDAGQDNWHRKLIISSEIISYVKNFTSEESFTSNSEDSFTFSGQKGEAGFTHNISKKENKKTKGVGSDGSSMDLFEKFWEAYPNQQKKPAAIKEWNKINPDRDLFEIIMAGLSAWKTTEQWTKNNCQFVPYPSNWLRDRRWEDQVTKPDGPDRFTEPASIDEAYKLLGYNNV